MKWPRNHHCILALAFISSELLAVLSAQNNDEREPEYDVGEGSEFDYQLSDPRRWIVYGKALTGGHLGGNADIFIQVVDENGDNVTSLHAAQQLSAVIEPPPAEAQMQELNGAINLRFVWRQVLVTMAESCLKSIHRMLFPRFYLALNRFFTKSTALD
jgi:hypothetical protein